MRSRTALHLRSGLVVALLLASCSPAPPRPDAPAGASDVPRASSAPTPPSAGASAGSIVAPTPPSEADAPSVDPTPAPVPIEPSSGPWVHALDALVSVPWASVAVGVGDEIRYVHRGATPRIPASAQKVLTSVAALETFGPDHRFATVAAARRRAANGTVRGDLWLLGGGDPELGPDRVDALAAALVRRGIHTIAGDVVGDTSAFSRRWWAPGWVEGISRRYVTRPTALVFGGNDGVVSPEQEAATAFVEALRRHGIAVGGDARTGKAPAGLKALARVSSAPLRDLLARQNHGSLNLHAEVLLRAIGDHAGAGTTAAGAEVVRDAVSDLGASVRVRDGSGLSHGNAVSAVELVSVLLRARAMPWGPTLERSLPGPGEGTLTGRLAGLPVAAKTGTLFTVPCSALAGFVRDARGRPIAFAVLSEGVSKDVSIALEDAVVGELAAHRVV